MKAAIIGLVLLAEVLPAATTFTEVWQISAGAVPDNSITGWSDTRSINFSSLPIVNVEVHLEISGGWNGDLYVTLQHDSGFSVLLNRPGRNLSDQEGSPASGMDVTFSDSATQNSHTASVFSGDFLPDGRNVSPFLLTDDVAQGPAVLSTFHGLDANGNWTLLVADVSPQFTSTVQSWGLTISVVPEASNLAVTSLLLAVGLLRRRRDHG